jgi:exopolysaccharide biosynthesis polyprenyl glycosylphosphotransferase
VRLAGHHIPAARVGLFVADAAIVLAASLVGWAVAADGVAAASFAGAAIAAAVVLLALYLVDLYDLRRARVDAIEGRRLLLGLGGATLGVAPLLLLAPVALRRGAAAALAASVAAAAALRAAAPWRRLLHRIVVVGEGAALDAFVEERRACDGGDTTVATLHPSTPDLAGHARRAGADAIVVATRERRGLPHAELLACRLAGIEVVEAAAWIERTRRKVPVDLIRPAALIYGEGFRRSRLGDAARRALSLAAAVTLVVLTAPLLLAAAIAVKLGSRGPVLYRQTRVGRGGRPFTIFKLRTMTHDAEAGTGAVWARERDPRVTRAGAFLRKTRLDELPQLWNVVRGDMDLVGPRPERPEFVAELAQLIPFFDVRNLVRPGLTGWAQIRFRYGASLEDTRAKLGFDLYYVKHASPLLDAIVLFHTAKTVLTGRGAR